MSELVKHAKREFEILGWPGDDDMQAMVCENIIELMQTFADQRHSGTTAPYVISYFERLAHYGILSPLTGEDDEWIDRAEEFGKPCWQNNRFGAVFKDEKDGPAYWIEGKLFRRPDGSIFNTADSRTEISFPWIMQAPEIIDTDEEGNII